MNSCPNCGHENPAEVNFCENCGTKLAGAQKQCPRCHTMVPNAARFCENCGYDFETADSEAVSSASVPKEAPISAARSAAAQAPTSQPVSPASHAVPSTTAQPQSHEANSNQTPPKRRSTKAARSKTPWIISGIGLLLILGIGGYFLYTHTDSKTTAEPARVEKKASSSTKQASSSASATSSKAPSSTANFDESQIKQDIRTTVGPISGHTSVYVSPVDRKQSVLINNGSQRSASSIKLFILVTAYAMAKENVLDLEATHTVTDREKVGGTGVIQNMDAGTKLTYRELLKHMIDDSDNTAANIIINKLGGFSLINNKIKSMGATDTKLRRKMMDTKALEVGRDNTTSARDMGVTLKKIYNHQLVSKHADEEMLAILEKNQNRTKLPKLLPDDVTVYNKTGEFSDYGVQNDAEIVANKHTAFVAVVLSADGDESEQVAAMNQLGLKLYQNILE